MVIATAIAAGLPLIGIAAPATGNAPEPAAAAQPPAFAQCKACHSVDPAGKSGIGPNLYGIAGKVAGAKPDYSYSPAMKAARKKWDRAGLDAFIKDPKAVVPGTKMMAPPVADAQKRKQIVDYLLALN
ncbi:hypothetical protein BFL28_06295 [Sphingomonas turrisvirgatae]|uniref:Cytochrome c domain-containing protein n=1 Tax=Sphingomonas turrisvirgatae TaxID=1888892 RepID=A0A1E3LRN9_9SPHN|nr:hypothetical protein BFL28_06295 [Sphingomonas turrisvirgatae]